MAMNMSETSDSASINFCLYDEDLNNETVLDLSSQNLETIPVIKNTNICVLYLQNNKIKSIPDDFFTSLPSLMWLDLRDNNITDIPTSIKGHAYLTHLLLQNNKITSLPPELGLVPQLKVLQLSGNPLMYPPREIIQDGVSSIINFLKQKCFENASLHSQSEVSETESVSGTNSQVFLNDVQSYNSVIHGNALKKTLSVALNERELSDSDDDEKFSKRKGRCPKLFKSQSFNRPPCYYQSSKYLKPLRTDGKLQMEKIKQSYIREQTTKKYKEMLQKRDKIIQDRKNMELLKNWRKDYKYRKLLFPELPTPAPTFPYDTNPQYMTLLSREDIEKDLPDKYRKKLIRKSKPTVPRKSTEDVHLALKIKQLFDNLEAIDMKRKALTPRSEQKILLGEIQKISEIQRKLMEISISNSKSVAD